MNEASSPALWEAKRRVCVREEKRKKGRGSGKKERTICGTEKVEALT
jgi:hypothetical protein